MRHFVGFLCLRLILCVLLALPIQILLRLNGNDAGIANAQSSSTQVKHKPLEYFVSGKRIHISAEVTDKEGVKLARCYFRSQNVPSNDYYFVGLQMKAGEKNVYQGIIPAPLQGIQEIEYVFLIVNNRNQIVKTETFSVKQKEGAAVPSWQTTIMDGQIQISTEIGQVLMAPERFEENAIVDITDTSQRFGIAAGLYGGTQAAMAGGITGDAAVAVSVGDIKTDTGGISWWWWAAALGVVLVAGAAAAGGGGGSSNPVPSSSTIGNVSVTW